MIDTWQNIFLFVLVAKGLTELYLALRHRNHVWSHRNQVPERFSALISLEDHQKAARYSIDKGKLSRFSIFFDTALLMLWTVGGGLNYLHDLARELPYPDLTLFLLYGLTSLIIGLPLSLYSTFVIEEKYGFNKTTLKIFFTDMIKQILLGAVLGLPILYALLWTMESLGSSWWLWGFCVMTAFQLFLFLLYPTLIAPLFNKFTKLEEGELKQKIEALVAKIGLQFKELFVMDASRRTAHGNAYFTGFGKNKRIVFFDNLLKNLNPDEVTAVLAHELGHFKKKHVPKMLLRSLIMSFLGFFILGQLYQSEIFFQAHGVAQVTLPMALLLFSKVSGVYTFFLTPLSSWFSRRYEFEADEFAAKHSDANHLIEALVKLYRESANTLTPDPVFAKFYYSHPPASLRVEHLEKQLSSS